MPLAVTLPGVLVTAPTRQPQGRSPWLADEAIFSVSVWWAKVTGDDSDDFSVRVAEVFSSLERDLKG